MVEELRRHFQQYFETIKGLHCLIICDHDGVPIIQVSNNIIDDKSLNPQFLSTFANEIEQSTKLGLKSSKKMLLQYTNVQVVCFNHSPLILILLADISSNMGRMLHLDLELKSYLDKIQEILA